MATIQLHTYHATVEGGFLSIQMNIGGTRQDPMPMRTFTATKTAEVLAAVEAMKAEGIALGIPFVIAARVKEGRAPAGFRDCVPARHYVKVNC
ncbi:MAG: hypothetical protein Q8K33_01600 [Cypionkella sp.]|uniref:hypothetical protein n=1 Tax=Cypionkella sp. TaxID=2811411 RepID=UPI002730D342|nr:hypothetical protein [Cypionkella sp.]MDP2047576.1 hypothetical protein [Cypionkella sp.]